MDATAGQQPEPAAAAVRSPEGAPRRAPVQLFLAVRRTRYILGAALGLGLLTAAFGSYETTLPTAIRQGDVTIPMWRLFAMGAATLPVLALNSQLSDLEAVATDRFRRYQRRYLGGIAVLCAALYLGIAAVTVDPLFLAVIARSWLAWSGLALIAGVWLGWRLAWTGPAVVAVVLWYWGSHGGGRYAWWEFSARPPDDPPPLLLSLGLLATGLIAYSATPWRRRRLLRRPSERR